MSLNSNVSVPPGESAMAHNYGAPEGRRKGLVRR